MASVTFLGTGNFLAPGRYWNSFVIDGTVLVEPSPSCLANLRKARIDPSALEAVFISHFHPDHTFGWPFLALELAQHERRSPLYVVGPPGVAEFLGDMMRLGAVESIHEKLHARVDVRYVEADGTPQDAGPVRFQAFEVRHVEQLSCFGFVIDKGGSRIGYSGDTEPCAGLEQIASLAEVLVLECAEVHRTASHMHVDAVAELQARHPGLRVLLTHLGEGVSDHAPSGAEVPDDLAVVEVP